MIAIVILGLGLLVAAAMFPIAWGKARDLAEHTTAESLAAAAEMAVKLTCRVDSAADNENFSSLAGSYVVETKSADSSVWPLSRCDTWVHPLAMKNLLVVPPSDPTKQEIDEDAWLLADAAGTLDGGDRYQLDSDMNLGVRPGQYYRKAQVQLGDRTYPTLPPRPDPLTAPPDDVFRWDTRFDGRVHTWAVFHRLNDFIPHPIYVPASPVDQADLTRYQKQRRERARRPRVFTMYYATLRRGAGQRFARQDEAALATGNIKALPHDAANPSDVKLPSPWLVPLLVTPDPVVGAGRKLNFRNNPAGETDLVPRGVPTEVTVEMPAGVPPGGDANNEDYREFFPVGAQFIDYVNGQAYRVVKRRIDEGPPLKAFLTLDREIFVEDLLDPNDAYDPNDVDLTTGDRLYALPPTPNRRVWVFPPSVEARKSATDPLVVEGRSPVVDITVRPMTIYPQ